MGATWITQELADEIEGQRLLYQMAGQEPPYPPYAVGDPLVPFLTALYFNDNAVALELASHAGVSQEELMTAVQPYTGPNPAGHGGIIGKVLLPVIEKGVAPIGNYVAEHPIVLLAIPAAIYAVAALAGNLAGSAAGEAATVAGQTTLTESAAATAGTAAASGGAATGVTLSTEAGIEVMTVTAAMPAAISPGLIAAASGTVATALAAPELAASVASGEVPPPPANTAGAIFSDWALDTGMGLLTQQVGRALTADEKKAAEQAMRDAIARQQQLMGNYPTDPNRLSPDLLSAMDAAKARNETLLKFALIGGAAILLALNFSE